MLTDGQACSATPPGRLLIVAAVLCLCARGALLAAADPEESEPADPAAPWTLHFQQTVVVQAHGGFRALYSGLKSLSPRAESANSLTTTIFAGASLWSGAEVYVDPELSGGRGLSGAVGVAGFTNGETFRIGNPATTALIARAYLRQTFGFGSEQESIADEPNQISRTVKARRVVLTVGKFGLADLFDDNRFSHDPRTQFLNWALMDNGAWDYAADTRGYTWGLAAELHMPGWALRAAAVLEPREANGLELDTGYRDAHGIDLEGERSYTLAGRPGTVRLLVYRNVAHMGNYDASLALASATGTAPDITLTRREGRTKNGIGANLEQELAGGLGLFARLGWNDGRNETWAFTEIDQTASAGVTFPGRKWARAQDRAGCAVVVNGLSAAHRAYLSAGGYGFIIGDGALRYTPEEILEAYYSLGLPRGLSVTADYQHVQHPAYNRDRGPVEVFALRVHWEL